MLSAAVASHRRGRREVAWRVDVDDRRRRRALRFRSSSPAPSASISRRAPSSPSSASPPRTGRVRAAPGCRAGLRAIGAAASARRTRQKAVDQRVDEPRLDPTACRRGGRARPRHRAASPKARPSATTRGRSKIPGCRRLRRQGRRAPPRPRLEHGRSRRLPDEPWTRAPLPPPSARSACRRASRRASSSPEPPAARKRDDRPAASTMAPILVTGRARLRAYRRSPSGARRPPSRGYPRRGSAPRPAPAAGPSRSRSLSATGRNPARR